MKKYFLFILAAGLLIDVTADAQSAADASTQQPSNNIYSIRQQYLDNVLHNPAQDNHEDNDNDLERFNRWFNLVEPRCYPSGELPQPDVLVKEWQRQQRNIKAARTTGGGTTTAPAWQPIGPMKEPINNNGIGRINCIALHPTDTNTLYVGAACGGVFISHDGGSTWTSNTDNFPSLSIADIAVNPHNPDTLYAATGDGYGYTDYGVFWGGLYSAGVMMSADGGNTWNTTGLSYIQSDNMIIQKLLLHPNQTNILLAATTNGIMRSTDAGATWGSVFAGHVYSMAFQPFQPDTVYAVDNSSLIVSYDAGATWNILHLGINHGDRATIAVTPASPNSIYLLNSDNALYWSHDAGKIFSTLASPNSIAYFYGYYDRVLCVAANDSNNITTCGMNMAHSTDGGTTWNNYDGSGAVHVDNHAAVFSPYSELKSYSGNDGGIFVTKDGGYRWTDLSNGLMISQIYRIATSRKDPYLMLCGLQDNGTFSYNSSVWSEAYGDDGMDCAIHPLNDSIQIASAEDGGFALSTDRGNTFNAIPLPSDTAWWTAPVVFNPNSPDTIYFGYNDIYASYDMGNTLVNLTNSSPFTNGAVSLAIAYSNTQVLYAADYGKLYVTSDGGTTWTNMSSYLPGGIGAITDVTVDYSNYKRIFMTASGYAAGAKVYVSNDQGNTWTNISYDLPNLPADCIVVDSSNNGGIFVGTDIGVYYMDSTMTGWELYGTGLPNVIADHLDINYTNYKIRVATYGRGAWECNLKNSPLNTPMVTAVGRQVELYPNPANSEWRLTFTGQKPANYTVQVSDITGRVIQTLSNADVINVSAMASGIYNIEIQAGSAHYIVRGTVSRN